MGSSESNNNNSINKIDEMMNEDKNLSGDLNIYICGNINTFLNCEDGFNFIASRNYYVLEQIFDKNNKAKSGNIQLQNGCEMYYQYELRQKIKDKKKYNAFLFFNKADEEFLDMLFDHLFEIDHKNGNKNVVIFFGEENEIIKSINKIEEKSAETVPFLIIINNSEYDDKLKYINYIPDLNKIKSILKEENEKASEDELSSLCEKGLINYINMKLFRIDMYYNQLGFNLNLINPMDETYLKIKVHITIGLLGYSGCGKSTLINLVFNQLVARTSASSVDVTKQCKEYYLPIKETDDEDVGQIRFIDFPGISEDKNYQNIVKPQLKKKLEEYKENMEQIDVALFFINNGNAREFNDTGLELVDLLKENNIKIIFVINGPINNAIKNAKKQKIRNQLGNKGVLDEDLKNVVYTNFFQNFKETEKAGISQIFENIIEAIQIKDQKFKVEEINVENYNEKLEHLSKCNRTFEHYSSMDSIKEKARLKANLSVAGYSALAFGSSAISLVIPVVDCALTIGYQVAMVYTIFNIYELKPKDYNIVNIIITGGCNIDKKEKKMEKKKADEDKNENSEIIKGSVKEVLKDTSNGAIFAGQYGIKTVATKEAGKVVIEKTVQTVVTDTVEIAAIKSTANTMEALIVNTVEKTVTNSVEKLAIESSKQLVNTGLKEGTNIAVNVAKEALVGVVAEGGEEVFLAGSKESIKTITETIIIKQGGKPWLINLGKAVPFIGAVLSAAMNTYSTAKLGKRLVDKFDEEFDDNQQRQVDLIKGIIYGIENVIEQMKLIIKSENETTKF